MSNGEPWDFFKTIENTAKGLEATKATARDSSLVGALAFAFAFFAFHKSTPHEVRASKDEVMRILKKIGLSQQLLDVLEEMMLVACDTLERQD